MPARGLPPRLNARLLLLAIVIVIVTTRRAIIPQYCKKDCPSCKMPVCHGGECKCDPNDAMENLVREGRGGGSPACLLTVSLSSACLWWAI